MQDLTETPAERITRRAFLAQAALAAAATLRAEESPRIIDTHTHFYDPSRKEGVPWPDKRDRLLYRTVLPAEYRKLAEPLGISGTVVVEASPWVEDNQWLLELAEDDQFILGVVGNLDPLSADFAANLKRFSAKEKFRGIRVAGTQLSEHGRTPAYLNAMHRLADTGLSLDINGPPSFLPHVAAIAREVPTLRIVINHVGSAGNPQALHPGWKDGIRAAAAVESVFCKVSALAEQAGSATGKAPTESDHYRPILDVVWDAFGSSRLIFGSNWPVSDNGTSLANVVSIVRPFFAKQGAEALSRYFGGNALTVYRRLPA